MKELKIFSGRANRRLATDICDDLNLSLGEEIRFVKGYTDILIAITNPQHVVTKQYSDLLTTAELAGGIEAFMPNMKKDMSAAQLIDLTTFLDKVYRKNLKEYQGEKK